MSLREPLDTLLNNKNLGAEKTTAEILQQPVLWEQIWQLMDQQKEALATFFDTAVKNSDYILFTGAGTSAFIGLSLHGLYFRRTGLISQAVATTDIVSHPEDYFDGSHKVFILSFARSGNSPESLAALELADQHAKYCYHLIITCDPNGALARFKTRGSAHLFTLPNMANDKGLAMTSAYSGMLLSAVLMANLSALQGARQQIKWLSKYTAQLFDHEVLPLNELAQLPYTRAVFLGSGQLYGTATEAGLKLQELTSGKIICKSDTYLGFRHGPKAVLNAHTLVVFFLSPQAEVRRYELDLARTIIEETASALAAAKSGATAIGRAKAQADDKTDGKTDGKIKKNPYGLSVEQSVSDSCNSGDAQMPLLRGLFIAPDNFDLEAVLKLTLTDKDLDLDLESDLELDLDQGKDQDKDLVSGGFKARFCCIQGNSADLGNLDPDFWPVAAVVPGQLLGLFSSLALGITPDRPSLSGAITRVVQGVTIYRDARPGLASAADPSMHKREQEEQEEQEQEQEQALDQEPDQGFDHGQAKK